MSDEKPKKLNLFQVMENLTGISQEEQKKMLDAIRENHKKLDGCTCHSFTQEVPKKNMLPDWVCENCGGMVSQNDKDWYEKGFKHALQYRATEENESDKMTVAHVYNLLKDLITAHKTNYCIIIKDYVSNSEPTDVLINDDEKTITVVFTEVKS
jgi:hypothetical protein